MLIIITLIASKRRTLTDRENSGDVYYLVTTKLTLTIAFLYNFVSLVTSAKCTVLLLRWVLTRVVINARLVTLTVLSTPNMKP